ncbi:MAG: hypothetical protein IKO41_11110 [Lachnospiraceae bacterium]|nr:hypothetical protein [Lachnospiraceae bacterium]MBR6150995.1 hypothetical protein [Lachnospiraceae bacterium]
MQLKTVLYPKVMYIENALKSYVIEALLADRNLRILILFIISP